MTETVNVPIDFIFKIALCLDKESRKLLKIKLDEIDSKDDKQLENKEVRDVKSKDKDVKGKEVKSKEVKSKDEEKSKDGEKSKEEKSKEEKKKQLKILMKKKVLNIRKHYTGDKDDMIDTLKLVNADLKEIIDDASAYALKYETSKDKVIDILYKACKKDCISSVKSNFDNEIQKCEEQDWKLMAPIYYTNRGLYMLVCPNNSIKITSTRNMMNNDTSEIKCSCNKCKS